MRLLPRRRPRLPEGTARTLEVAAERVLAWSPLALSGVAVVTDRGLRVLTPYDAVVRRPWVEVDHMSWDDDSRTLAVWWVGSRQALGLELPEDSFVPEVAHERWRASVLGAREVALPGGRPAHVALRRDAGGVVSDQVNLPAGVRGTDPAVQRVVQEALAGLREDAGVAPGAAPGTGPDAGLGLGPDR